MVLLPINGIEVDFPYQPYGAQIRYMSNVIDALRGGNNALLESPTGTGKTLCVLCAALAWRTTYIAALQAHANSRPGISNGSSFLLRKAGLQPPTGAASALAAVVRPDLAPQLSAPRIIFSSRTHSQLSQAVAELKKTTYKPAMTILASRDQLCIHGISSNFSGSRLNAMCRRITAPTRRSGRCQYHAPIASSRPHENRSAELVDKVHSRPPMDIEDLRSFGEGEGACPWYLSRAVAKSDECEILFLPYNYLLDQTVRTSLGIDWSNDILIIDEAHNLESVCCESMSFDLSDSVRKACDLELSKLIEHAVRPGGLVIPALEDLAKTEKGLDKVIGSEHSGIMEIRLMRTILQSLEEFITTAALDRGDGSDIGFRVFPGNQLRLVLERAGGPTAETYELFLEMLERALGIQVDNAKSNANTTGIQNNSSASTGSGGNSIALLQSAIRVLFESCGAGHERHFRTVVQQINSNSGGSRTVSYWCFKPAVAMRSFQQLRMRCMLLTSGTLSPLDSFASELGVDFPVRLENPHVVTKAQVWAGIVPRGPDHDATKGKRLTSAYHQRGNEAHTELGRAMIKIASTVPDGLLVFFPSYSSMYSCIDAWKRLGPGVGGARPSIWEHLLRYKRIVAEERDSSKFAAAILAHRTNVDAGGGSMLLAVCRGKVSEGIDFSDEYGRAVVITGLPYPSAMDPKVILKRELCDEEAKSDKKVPHVQRGVVRRPHSMSGSEWYTTQALRAVNQAVGRSIRHKFDYGAIILCEERFQSKRLQEQVSKWIRPSLIVCSEFQKAETSLESFFTNAVKSDFAKEGEQKRLEAKRRQREREAQTTAEESTEAVLIAQETIRQLLPPPTTERQFLQQVMSLSGELKEHNLKRQAAKVNTSSSNSDMPIVKVLNFNTEAAESGLKDSGSLRKRQKKTVEAQDTSSGSKRSAMFLAARAERLERQADAPASSASRRVPKRIRVTQTKDAVMPSFSVGNAEKQPLSKTVKELFAKEDVREFLRRFRQVLTLCSRLKDGVGPLQTVGQTRQLKEEALKAVTDVVRFTKQNIAKDSQENFFQELRSKIPSAFRGWYDEAIVGTPGSCSVEKQ